MVDRAPRYPSHDPDIERHQENPARPPLAPYEPGGSALASYSERPIPLFLTDRDDAPDRGETIRSLMKGQGSYYASRILAGAVGGVAIALVAALLSSDAARDFIARAKASGVAALSVASMAMQPGSVPSKVAAVQPKESLQPSAAGNPAPLAESVTPLSAASGTVVVAAATPTREDVKTADPVDVQGAAPQAAVIPEPVAPEPVAPPEVIRHLDASEVASLLKRADTLIESGDLAAARLVLRRVAEAGNARAALMLGGTYDPAILEKLGVRGVVPDMAIAQSWYEKSRRFSISDVTPQSDLLAKKQD